MSDFDSFERSLANSQMRTVNHTINLSAAQSGEIIDDLIANVDELRIFSPPTTTMRKLGGVSLSLGQDSRLPVRYSQLELTQSTIEDSEYSTQLKLPGQTLYLEGRDKSQSGLWRATSGNSELASYEHTDLIAHLRSILPKKTTLDQLADRADISDGEIVDQLWNALSPLSDNWKDSRQYTASDYAFSPAQSPAMEDYYNEVGAMLGYVEGYGIADNRQRQPAPFKKYTSRISTQRPIDLSWSNEDTDSKPSNVGQEFYFEVLYPEKIDATRSAIAHLALESATIANSQLSKLAHDTVLRLDDPASIYRHTTSLVRGAHLSKDKIS